MYLPNPERLKIGDIIIFKSRPKEWLAKGYCIQGDDIGFMDLLIRRKRKCTVKYFDEFKTPWLEIILRINGIKERHSWGIFETSGWVKMTEATEAKQKDRHSSR